MPVSVINKSGLQSNIIPLSLTQAYDKNVRDMDEIRADIQEWLYDFYSGDYSQMIYWLEQDIIRVLGKEIVYDQEWLYDFVNVTKKMIDRMAVVYKEPAKRVIASEIDQDKKPVTDYLDYILPVDVNTKDKRAHRFGKLFNTSLTQVYFNRNTGKIDFSIEPSHKYRVEVSSDNPYEITKVEYRKYLKNTSGQDEYYTIVWTADEHYKIDQQGNRIPVGNNTDLVNPWRNENGDGVLPFPKLMIEQGEDIWGIGQNDLVNVNENVNFLLTFLINDSIVMGSGGNLIATNLNLTKKGEEVNGTVKPRSGRRHPYAVDNIKVDDAQPNMQYVSTEPLIAEIQNSIDYRIKQIAVIKGLNPNTIISEIKDTSDYQKMMDYMEMIEVRRDDVDPCRTYEMERWEIIKAVNNTAYQDPELKNKFKLQEIPWDAELKVDFADIKMELSPDQLWSDRAEREQRNMKTPIDWLMEENTELTKEEAEQILQQNKEINSTNSRKPSALETLLSKRQEAGTGKNQ